MKNTVTRRGFTLLYAVLVSSLLLSLGLAIFNVTLKGLDLSSTARESQFAFYAADLGVECALYWDLKQKAFATSTSSSITCAGQTFNGMGGSGYNATSTFTINLNRPPNPLPYCAVVSVVKQPSPDRTLVEARGYNTCDTGNPRRVERAIRARY
ncbi:MAG TPA: hypothetical protein VGA06_00820 [Candidatus Paceibacterota bacterium]|jgi:Tfp pilus assembly protein PilX